MPLRDYPPDEIARQPIGYWSGHAYRTVVGRIRQDLAMEALTQPKWWILNHLDGAETAWTRPALIDRLRPFDDQDTDFEAAFDELRDRELMDEAPGGGLRLTESGAAKLRQARDRSSQTLVQTMSGIADDDYVATLNTLRRIVDNLGGDSDIP